MIDHDHRTAILSLSRAGNGVRAIAKALGVSRNTVKKVLTSASAEVPPLERDSKLTPHLDRVRELHRTCRGNLVRVRELLDDARLVEVAESEHANADELIGELRSMSIDEPRFDEKVAALSVVIQRHIDAEEEDLLPLLSQQGADLQQLGERMAERKQELIDEQAQEE